MKFIIGKTVDKSLNLSIDAQVLADTRALICASSGAGKSMLLRLIAEQVGEKIQTVIIDPEGEFPTLREKLDVLVVGENGDVQANVQSAGLLARKLAETGVSSVIDIYDLPGKGDPWDKRRAFVAEFLTALMNLPKSSYHPMLIIIDEAHQFAPEAKGSESSNASRSAVNSLMSAGRKRGFGGILATQRISKIHKDSIADARNIFIGGTTLDIDQQRAGDMLGMSKAESVTLRELAPGEFYCYGPATGDKYVKLFHATKAQTTHPKAGQRSNIAVPKASTKIVALTEQFGDLPSEAQAEVDERNALLHKVFSLERQIKERPVQIQPEVQIKEIEVPVIQEGQIEAFANILLGFNEIGGHFTDEVKKFQTVMNVAKEFVVNNQRKFQIPLRPESFQSPMRIDKPVHTNHTGTDMKVDYVSIDKLSKAERSILTVLAQYPAGRSINQIAILAGYAVGTGGFNNAIGALRTKQYISGGKDKVLITNDGHNALGDYEPLPTGEGLIQYWKMKLGKAELAAFNVLVRNAPHPCERDWIAQEAGYTPGTGGINNAMGRLKTLELAVPEGNKYLKLNPTLWN